MGSRYDAIVLGTGGVGSAPLWHLARRGKKVLGLDMFPPGHDRGSSHGESRVIRQAYFEHPDYVPLVLKSYELWAELEEVTKQQLFFPTGLLQVGPPEGTVIQGVRAAARQHGLELHELNPSELSQRFPQFNLSASDAAVFETKAGYLLVEHCVQAHLAAARRAGADWRQERVNRWSLTGERTICVETEAADYQADHLVISAGPWSQTMLADFRAITVLAKHLHWYAADSPAFFAVRLPYFLVRPPRRSLLRLPIH